MSEKTTKKTTKSGKVPAPADPKAALPEDPNALRIVMKEGDDQAAAVARNALDPSMRAASVAAKFDPLRGMTNINAIRREIEQQAQAVISGDFSRPEALLTAQAHTLDGIFQAMALAAASCMEARNLHGADTYMRMALKAQSQCRTTMEALSEIKNPRSPTFIRQQNVANQQQVNNGVPAPAAPHAHEKTINEANELLEASHGQRLDTGTQGTAGGANPDLAAVGAVNRAKD